MQQRCCLRTAALPRLYVLQLQQAVPLQTMSPRHCCRCAVPLVLIHISKICYMLSFRAGHPLSPQLETQMTARHLPTLGFALLVLVLVTDLPHKAAAIRTRSLAAANGPRCYKDCYMRCTNCFNVPVYGMPSRDQKAAGCGWQTNCPCAVCLAPRGG